MKPKKLGGRCLLLPPGGAGTIFRGRRDIVDNQAIIRRIARRIRAARKAKGLRTEDLAAVCGVHHAQIERMESMRYQPTIKPLILIGKALDKPLSWFLEPGPDGG